jgi:hypothetical protein
MSSELIHRLHLPSPSPSTTCFPSSPWAWPADRGAQVGGAQNRQRASGTARRASGDASSPSTSSSAWSPAFPWSSSSAPTGRASRRLSGGVIGQPLAMEGVFSFFLESAFLGLFLYGEKRISKLMHWFSAVMVFVGSWISGFFIIVTDAWMQHPVAFDRLPNGSSRCSASGNCC